MIVRTHTAPDAMSMRILVHRFVGRKDGSLVSILVALAILSLFADIRYATGFIQIRPFDPLVAWMFMLTVLQGKIWRKRGLVPGFLILLPFFCWHAGSAFTISAENGLRETLQIVVVTMFAWTLSQQIDVFDYDKMGRIILFGLFLAVTYLCFWGLFISSSLGWKLPDTKASLTFLPLALSCTFAFSPAKDRRRYLLIWLALGAVILFSGERKALLTYFVTSAVLLARGRVLNYLPAAAALVILLILFASTTSNNYLAHQMSTMFNPFDTGQYTIALIDKNPALGDSWSNAQRAFAFNLGFQLIRDHPLFGIGTNGYVGVIADQYWYIPAFMQVGIHNEFMRVWTENGTLGLICYLSVWLFSYVRLARVLRLAHQRRIINARQRAVIPPICFTPCFFYLFLEATGTHSFVILIFLSFLPDFLHYMLPWHAKHVQHRSTASAMMRESQIASVQVR
jgi:hypothetical protein